MIARKLLVALLVIPGGTTLFMVSQSNGEDIRIVEKDGVKYRETRNIVKRAVVETHMQARERTVYREQISTEYQPQTRTVYTPVTTYKWQPKLHDVLNPFKKNIGYNLVPTTQWQPRIEQVDVQVTRREMIPKKEIVDVPVTRRRLVDEEIIRRTVVNDRPGSNGTSVARRSAVGGVSRVENEVPREGTGWRAAGNSSIR